MKDFDNNPWGLAALRDALIFLLVLLLAIAFAQIGGGA